MYQEKYFKRTPLSAYIDLAKTSDPEKIAIGVNHQMRMAEDFMDILQYAANNADLEIYYDSIFQRRKDEVVYYVNKMDLEYYRERGSRQALQESIDCWRLFDMSLPLNDVMGGVINKETHHILDDLSSLEFLGLTCIDEMTSEERKKAIVHAMSIVRERILETTWETDKAFCQATDEELREINSVRQLKDEEILRMGDVERSSHKIACHFDAGDLPGGKRRTSQFLQDGVDHYNRCKNNGDDEEFSGKMDKRS